MLRKREEQVRCPFDATHLVLESRLQVHVMRCMKNYPNHVKCPYNILHCFLSENQLAEHIRECPDKVYSQPWRLELPRNANAVPIHIDVPKDSGEEDWEKDYRL